MILQRSSKKEQSNGRIETLPCISGNILINDFEHAITQNRPINGFINREGGHVLHHLCSHDKITRIAVYTRTIRESRATSDNSTPLILSRDALRSVSVALSSRVCSHLPRFVTCANSDKFLGIMSRCASNHPMISNRTIEGTYGSRDLFA